MRITIEYRNPTPSHCDVAVWINGGLSGTLCLRQEELLDFQQIMDKGCRGLGDNLTVRGNPDPNSVEKDLGK